MEEQTVRQVQGAVELLRDGVQGAARSIGAVQEEIAGISYGVLRHIPLVAGPAAAAGRVQMDITQLAYRSVSAAAGAVAAGVTLVLQLHHSACAR